MTTKLTIKNKNTGIDPFRGRLVQLRGIEREDLPLIVSWRNDPSVYQNFVEHEPLTMARQEQWFEQMLKNPSEKNFLIALPEGTPIGTIGMGSLDFRSRVGEFVRFIIGDHDYRFGGHAVEAEKLILTYAFGHLNLHKVFCTNLSTNPKVISLHERFGFTIEGTFRQHLYKNGAYIDLVLMGVLKDEFETALPSIDALLTSLDAGGAPGSSA